MGALVAVATMVGTAVAAGGPAGAATSFIGRFKTTTTGASTVPANGDVNPYGLVVIPETTGKLVEGDALISNFNNNHNLQGTGTTIVEIDRKGHQRLFAQIDPTKLPGPCPGGVGLTTALAVLRDGWVVVGSLPTADGMAATAKAGCLLVLNRWGHVVETWSGDPINGPWDLTAKWTPRGADLFVTNVLNGTVAANGNTVNGGTVVRINVEIERGDAPEATEKTVIGRGFPERTDPAALVVGPTGVALNDDGTLYVADTAADRIATIPNAVHRDSATTNGGHTVTTGNNLKAPLGLILAPNDDILTVNGGDGNTVETTPGGVQLATAQLDSSGSPPGAGALFDLALVPHGHRVLYVDDATNTLNLFH
jgi:hypothetical protein